MINFECPKCSKKIKAPEAAAGRRVPCPGCKAAIDVPSVPTAAKQAAVIPKPPAPKPTAKPRSFDDDDFKLQPEPGLKDLGLDASNPPDPFAKPFNTYAPPEATEQASPYMAPMPTPKVSTGTVAFQLPSKRKYIALTIVRYALLVLAALVAIGWLFTVVTVLIAVLANSSNPDVRGGVAIGGGMYLAITFFSGAITCCMLVASSELIKLAMDVQENTLAAAHAANS
jgi:hypothetical protein